MKKGLIFLAVLAWVLIGGFFLFRPDSSVLPEFDSARFTSHGPSGRSVVDLKGPAAQRLRSVFEGIPRERDPQKWIAFGRLTLLNQGKEVLEIDVLSGPGAEGPFGIVGKDSYLGYNEPGFRTLLKEAGWSPDPAR